MPRASLGNSICYYSDDYGGWLYIAADIVMNTLVSVG